MIDTQHPFPYRISVGLPIDIHSYDSVGYSDRFREAFKWLDDMGVLRDTDYRLAFVSGSAPAVFEFKSHKHATLFKMVFS